MIDCFSLSLINFMVVVAAPDPVIIHSFAAEIALVAMNSGFPPGYYFVRLLNCFPTLG